MKRGKAQYSVEFLVTYGWALLIIGIVIGAIYTFGWFDPGELLPQKCEFYGQLGCRDFFLDTNTFSLSLVNNFGANLNIGRVDFIVEDDPDVNCSTYFDSTHNGGAIPWERNDFSIISMAVSGQDCEDTVQDQIIEGARVKLTTTIYYYSNTTCSGCETNGVGHSSCTPCVHKSVGRLNIRVN